MHGLLTMKRWLVALLCALALPVAAQSPYGVRQSAASAGGGGYTGPGDIVSGAKVWVGLRGYTAAIASGGTTPAVRLIRTDTHQCDVLIASNGGLGNTSNCSTGGDNATAVATWCNATTCNIDIFYDQSGNGFNFQANGPSNRATLTLSCLSSLPCADFTSAAAYYQATITDTAQTLSYSYVVERTGNTSAQNDLYCLGNCTFFDTTANIGAYFGNTGEASITNSAWHAVQIIVNGASNSAVAVDATQTTGLNMGTATTGANFWLGSQNSGGTNPLTGKLTEAGMWGPGTAFTGTQQTNMCHNQFTYWGTPTSC
jgi:hypothetical protein